MLLSLYMKYQHLFFSDDDMLVDPTSSHLVMSSLLLKSLSSCQDESIIKVFSQRSGLFNVILEHV